MSTIPFPGVDDINAVQGEDLPIWVGIELDEPLGKNDGCVGAVRYFSCPRNTGLFAKPDRVEVGDFPPLPLDLSDDEDMEEM